MCLFFGFRRMSLMDFISVGTKSERHRFQKWPGQVSRLKTHFIHILISMKPTKRPTPNPRPNNTSYSSERCACVQRQLNPRPMSTYHYSCIHNPGKTTSETPGPISGL